MKKTVAFLFSTAGMLLLLRFASPQGDVVMSSSTIPLATWLQQEDFRKTNQFLMGIKANDPVNAIPVQKYKDKWYMLTWDKRNVAGVFNRYGTEEEDHNAYDWNMMIDPFDEYKYVYEQALLNPCKTLARWPGCIDYSMQKVRCDDTDYNNHSCFWTEISPYHYFLNTNKWFKGTHDEHCKEGEFLKRGDTLAVYGFPVADEAHGYNPEIHPAQQIWFRYKEKTNKDKSTYLLFFIQDASDRFGNWSGSPIYGQFLVPFRAKPSAINPQVYTPVTMNISIAERHDLVTKNYPAYSADADDGNSHALVVDGKKLVVVNEPQAQEDNKGLGISFTDMSKLADGTIQGYVQVSMVLGDYNTDPIGVCVLELEVVKANNLMVLNPKAIKN
jgi:hypothetical protein